MLDVQKRIALSAARADVTVTELFNPSASPSPLDSRSSSSSNLDKQPGGLQRKADFIAVKLPRHGGETSEATKAVIFRAVGDGSLSVANATHGEASPNKRALSNVKQLTASRSGSDGEEHLDLGDATYVIVPCVPCVPCGGRTGGVCGVV